MKNIKPKSVLRVKIMMLVLLIFASFSISYSQNETITLEECQQWAQDNYPLVKQLALIEQSTDFTLENINKAKLPQISLNGQFTYQSEVTSIPINIPNIEIPTINKQQYKLYIDAYKSLTNYNEISTQKELVSANAAIEQQQIEVELRQLKERINQLYFGVLLIDETKQQLLIYKENLQSTHLKIKAAVQNGIAIEANAQQVEAEIINIDQKLNENALQKQTYLNMLAALTQQTFSENISLALPLQIPFAEDLNRKELQLFALQTNAVALQEQRINNRKIPAVGLFLQAGFGNPALNMFQTEISPYYIGGLRLNWNLSSLYTNKNDRQIIGINQQKINHQQQLFILNAKLQLQQQATELEKYETLIQNDEKLLALRQDIKKTAAIQLENGIITTTDFLQFSNDENTARLNLALHKMQLLMQQYLYATTSGNY
ncbi:MAG: transporter [Chitinophagales bacterium]|nr:TolC family protein [Bacteroidota bacterium]MCB9044094.1 TolC family protein [Chitinophagales bacterium]